MPPPLRRRAAAGVAPASHLRTRGGAPRADVGRAPGPASLRDRVVRPPRISNVGEIATRVEVPDGDGRWLKPRLDCRNLTRESGGRERGILTRAEMIERPCDHD